MSPCTSPMAICCYAPISVYATSSLGLSTKFSKSNNFLVKLVLRSFKTNPSLKGYPLFWVRHLFAELLQRSRRGGERDHSEVVIRVYFWEAGGRMRSMSSSPAGPKPVVLSPQRCSLSTRPCVLKSPSCCPTCGQQSEPTTYGGCGWESTYKNEGI